MKEPQGLFQTEIETARNELRGALEEVAPRKPFNGVDYKKTLRAMQSDPRILNRVGEWREFYHMAQEGMDAQTAKQKAAEELTRFTQTFGGD